MKKQINYFYLLLEHNKISLPQGSKKYDVGPLIEDHERFHALKEALTQSKYYLIYSRASNRVVSSKESFTTLDLSGGTSINMGDNSHILVVGRVSIKIQHEEFKNVLYVPSLTENLLFVYQMTHTGLLK